MANCISPSRVKKTIALNLYKKFSSLKLTFEEIAEDLGVQPRSVYYWIDGRSTPKINKLIEIANYLEIRVDDLLN